MSDNTSIQTAPVTLYGLEMLFNDADISAEELQTRAESAIARPASKVELRVAASSSGALLLSLRASLEDADECHERINATLLRGPMALSCVRLKDEAGDEARRLAYPILSRIEQRLRSWINQRATEVLGFNWWADYAPKFSQKRVRGNAESDALLESIEGTQFDQLLELITAKSSKWPQDKALSATDLQELLSGADSVEQVRAALDDKLKKFSFWDDLFAAHFTDRKQWDTIKGVLEGLVKEQRNRVMHHRPFRLGMVHTLEAKERELQALFDTSVKLAPEKREQVREEAEDVAPLLEEIRVSHHGAEPYVPMGIDVERVRAAITSARDLREVRRHLNEFVPTADKLAEMHSRYTSMLPSPEEVQRIRQQAASASLSVEEVKRNRENYERLAQQGQEVLRNTMTRGILVPEEDLRERLETIRNSLAITSPILEQLRRAKGF